MWTLSGAARRLRPLSRAALCSFSAAPAPAANRLADYMPYPYAVEQVHLDFHLGGETARCTSTLQMAPRLNSIGSGGGIGIG
jgi:hypothetical protein